MFHIGKFNVLKVKKKVRGGCYLDGITRDIYLPKKDTPRDISIGDEIKVFIYNDAKDSLKATTREPLATAGEFAYLRVKDVTNFGAFMEWGIDKDLFIPQKHILTPLKPGHKVLVYVMLDYEKKGIIGTCYVNRYIKKEAAGLSENEEVDLLVFAGISIGYKVIINNEYMGLIYKNEIFEEITIGDKRKGYIKRIRENGSIDAALQPQGFVPSSANARERVLQVLKNHEGYLPLTDKSNPEKIKGYLKISKKLFKKVIGGLYKEKIIVITKDGIRLL